MAWVGGLLGALAVVLYSAVPAQAACRTWDARTVVEDLGILENLAFDRRGGLLLSASQQKAIVRLTPDGSVRTLVPDVSGPGGMALRGETLYFNTGDLPWSGLLGSRDGTVDKFNLRTGERSTWATGLSMPNGLAFLPGGDAVVSRDVRGDETGVTRVPRDDPSSPHYRWAALADSNGLAVDPSGDWLYTVETFTVHSAVYRIRIERPQQIEVVARLADPQPKFLDDMTIDEAGVLYIASNKNDGQIIRLDPGTGEACVIARGLGNPSSVRFGAGPGWSSERLYVSGFDGSVTELAPAS